MEANPVDALYRERGIDFQTSDATLAEVVERAATLPLIAQPGRAWNYSIATDVLGHLVAVISGQPFETFLAERVLEPLGMADTGFFVPADKVARFAANYAAGPGGKPDSDRRSPGQHLPQAAARSPRAAAASVPPWAITCASAG